MLYNCSANKESSKQVGDIMKLKQKDYALFCVLRENARQSLTKLSKRTKIPISTIYERLRVLYGGIITRYVVLFNYVNLGYPIRIFFIVKAQNATKEKLRSYLATMPCVNTLHRVNHGFDFLGEAIFKDLHKAEQFLESIEETFKVKKRETFYILETIKQEDFMPETFE